jgi:4-hydroxy-3-polyprenylbenzoate decarboxylase
MNRQIAVAITGASGAIHGLRLVEELLQADCRVSLLISKAGFLVLREECGIDWSGTADALNSAVRDHFRAGVDRLSYYEETDFHSPLASGSAGADAMVVAPCSMGTLARIAAGLSSTLLERAADVMLKEGRPLVLVPRETPLSAIHLVNMLKLARLGVAIVPPMPGFYNNPATVDDIVNFTVGKVLNRLGIRQQLLKPWGGE